MILGIDPGITGAVALIDDLDGVAFNPEVEDLPVTPRESGKGNEINALLLYRMLELHPPGIPVFVERVHASPQMGVTSAFSFGQSYGTIRGVLAGLGSPVRLVAPQTWKKFHGLTTPKGLTNAQKRAHKDKARTVAIRLFPNLVDELTRKKDLGRAEALLIAEYGRRAL